MSIDLNWETLTGGPDGAQLAERIRLFIHTKFQTVPLPRFIRSVTVHGFDFGSVPPSLALKDITDPLPDFYQQVLSDDSSSSGADEESSSESEVAEEQPVLSRSTSTLGDVKGAGLLRGPGSAGLTGLTARKYFQSHFGPGWMGSTPVSRSHSRSSSISVDKDTEGREGSDVDTLPSRPSTRDAHVPQPSGQPAHTPNTTTDNAAGGSGNGRGNHHEGGGKREAKTEDVQAVFRIRYAGDVRLNLTAEILLDYPMPSFVGIPLKLSITGLSFDGVGVLAYIRKKVHFCFLSPEDALAAVGDDEAVDDAKPAARFAGLLQEIKVESEIGERDGGKQSLKNVGKVERFVLEQVRRIFEEEFVYPSFWTFLV